MFIHPFAAGVFATLFIEFAAFSAFIIIHSVRSANRKRDR